MIRRIWDRMRRFFSPLPPHPPPPPPIDATIEATPLEHRAALMRALNEESSSQLTRDFEMMRTTLRERRR